MQIKLLAADSLFVCYFLLSHIRVALTSFSKQVLMRNLSNSNEFDLQENLSARKINQSSRSSVKKLQRKTNNIHKNNDKWIKMVNFELDNETRKMSWSTWHERGTKEKFWVPDRNRAQDLPNTNDLAGAVPTELALRELMESKVMSSCMTGVLSRTSDLSGWSARPVFGRSWVWFLSGTQIFSLFHARVMLINSSLTLTRIH